MAGKTRVAPRPFSSGEPHDYTDVQLMEAVHRIIKVYVKIGNEIFGCNMPMPSIAFDLCETKPDWAGAAIGDFSIEINLILLRDNVEHLLNNTTPHEVAHLFQHHLFNKKGVDTQGHGAEWQEIMRKLGKDPFKYHSLDTSKAREFAKQAKKEKKAKAKGDEE